MWCAPWTAASVCGTADKQPDAIIFANAVRKSRVARDYAGGVRAVHAWRYLRGWVFCTFGGEMGALGAVARHPLALLCVLVVVVSHRVPEAT